MTLRQNDSDVVFKNNVIQRKDNLFVKNNSYSLQTKYSDSAGSYQQKQQHLIKLQHYNNSKDLTLFP